MPETTKALRKDLRQSFSCHNTYDTAAAERMGLINCVVLAADLEAEAMALAQRLANGPTVALGNLRRLTRGAFDRDLASQFDAKSAAFQTCAASDDFRIGLDAFFGKKPASFTGR
jgi:2-(1,2-epoxy-1,2-dihydrophenyl)acetyl-CoA isomerase